MTGIVALYIFMLAAFTGYEVIARVPVKEYIARVEKVIGASASRRGKTKLKNPRK